MCRTVRRLAAFSATESARKHENEGIWASLRFGVSVCWLAVARVRLLEWDRVCVSVWVCVCVCPVGWQSQWPRAVARRQSAIRKSGSRLGPDEFHCRPYLHGLLFGDLFRIKGECTRHGEGKREGGRKQEKQGDPPPPHTHTTSTIHPHPEFLFITSNLLSFLLFLCIIYLHSEYTSPLQTFDPSPLPFSSHLTHTHAYFIFA